MLRNQNLIHSCAHIRDPICGFGDPIGGEEAGVSIWEGKESRGDRVESIKPFEVELIRTWQ